MRNFTFTFCLAVMSTIVMAFTSFNKAAEFTSIKIEPSNTLTFSRSELKPEAPVLKIELKDHNSFLDAIGHRESSNNYKAVNQYGYLGKYQFGRKTLNALGYSDISNRKFLSDSIIQEQAMEDLLVHNKKILSKYIKKYNGKEVHGVLITESGVLAAAHLAGAGNVRKFFRKGYEFKDGNGTKLTSYLIRFSNYRLDL